MWKNIALVISILCLVGSIGFSLYSYQQVEQQNSNFPRYEQGWWLSPQHPQVAGVYTLRQIGGRVIEVDNISSVNAKLEMYDQNNDTFTAEFTILPADAPAVVIAEDNELNSNPIELLTDHAEFGDALLVEVLELATNPDSRELASMQLIKQQDD